MFLYFTEEKIVAYVVGYDNSQYAPVADIIQKLSTQLDMVAKVFQCDKTKIHTFVAEHSQRYKRMRVYFAKDVEKPVNALEVGGWTMSEWITN